jgi:AraC-like DNA-binding protein
MPRAKPSSLKPEPAALPSRLRTSLLSDGTYLFEDELAEGVLEVAVITCSAWLLELYELKSGSVGFVVDTKKVRPAHNCFGVLYPPFSLTRVSFQNPRGRVIGIAGSVDLPAEFLSSPLLFNTSFVSMGSAAAAIDLIRAGTNRHSVKACPSASLLSQKAKRLIDENHLAYPSIARIAQRVGVSHAHLSRQFRKDFGMSPSEYLRKLRVADAPLRLARGEEIINVSFDVGYNDLSRFYKQFRKTTNTSPGVCKSLLGPKRS